MKKNLRERICSFEMLVGEHAFFGVPMLTEALAMSGVDMIWVDMEHTPIDKSQVVNNLIAARAGGAYSLVRIPWSDAVLAKPILDMGPDGIIFPYIRSLKEAEAAISYCEYPPLGVRGYGPQRASKYWTIDPIEYITKTQRDMARLLQIEHIDILKDLPEIAKLDGFDGFIVGPCDLSASIGHNGDTLHPDVVEVYDEIGRILRGKKPFGVSAGFENDTLKSWVDRGATMLFSGGDAMNIMESATRVAEKLKSISGK